MKRFREQSSMKLHDSQNLTDAPSGRQTMLPAEGARVAFGDSKDLRQLNRESIEDATAQAGVQIFKGKKAGPEKWEKIIHRAGEIAMNKGRRPEETGERDVRRAKRELLGLQTLHDPDNPLATVVAHG